LQPLDRFRRRRRLVSIEKRQSWRHQATRLFRQRNEALDVGGIILAAVEDREKPTPSTHVPAAKSSAVAKPTPSKMPWAALNVISLLSPW
jgi:hypothetical protein